MDEVCCITEPSIRKLAAWNNYYLRAKQPVERTALLNTSGLFGVIYQHNNSHSLGRGHESNKVVDSYIRNFKNRIDIFDLQELCHS